MADGEEWHCECGATHPMFCDACFLCERPRPAQPPTAAPPLMAAPSSDDWLCDSCGASNSSLTEECFVCGVHRLVAAAPPEALPLERLPSDVPPDFFAPTPDDARSWQSLSPGQQAAMQRLAVQARAASEAAMPELIAKAEKMHFSAADVRRTLKYLRDEAPIVIHVNLQKHLKLFLEDTRYRSLFEIGSSGGSNDKGMRVRKENRMFADYYDGLDDFKRVKYGVLNATKSPLGVNMCRRYGKSHFILKGMRLRTSFSDQNSCNASTQMGTAEYMAHVINKYDEASFRRLLEVGKGNSEWASSEAAKYREVQLHGVLEFSRDFEVLVVDPEDREAVGDEPIIAFCARNGIDVIWATTTKPAECEPPFSLWDRVPAEVLAESGVVYHPAPPVPEPVVHRTLVGNDVPWYGHGAYVPSPPLPPAAGAGSTAK